MVHWTRRLIRIHLHLLSRLLLYIFALISFDDHLWFIYPNIVSWVYSCIDLNLVIIKIVHKLLQLTMRVIPLVFMIRRVVLHCLVLRSRKVRLLLLCLRRLYERFGCGKAICCSVEADVNLIIGHGEVGKVHLDHVVAKAALLGQLAELVLVLLLQLLHLLLHLLQCQV